MVAQYRYHNTNQATIGPLTNQLKELQITVRAVLQNAFGEFRSFGGDHWDELNEKWRMREEDEDRRARRQLHIHQLN